MSLWMKALWDLIKAQSLCPQRGRPGPAVCALGALQRRRWVLSERVHGVWLSRVSSLHQSPPPWHSASPPCGWFSVNHQLPHAGKHLRCETTPKGRTRTSDTIRREPDFRRRKTFTFDVSLLSKMQWWNRNIFFKYGVISLMGILSKDRCKSYSIPHVCPLLFSVLLVFKKTTTTDWDHLYKKNLRFHSSVMQMIKKRKCFLVR